MFYLYPKLAIGLIAFVLPLAALASAVFDSIQGDVKVAVGAQTPAPAKPEQRLTAGSTVFAGPDARVVLRFDDDQRVVLGPNTEFRIVDFLYPRGEPRRDRAEFELRKGALRMTTGGLARRSPEAFALRTPQTTLKVRGTDFLVLIDFQTYVQVLEGVVSAATKAGTGVFGAGTYAVVPSAEQMALAVSAGALPTAVHAGFNEVRSPKLAAQAGSEGAAAGVPAASGAPALSTATLIAIGAAAAVLALAAGGGGGSTPTPTSHNP
jgi:hypothetical protein